MLLIIVGKYSISLRASLDILSEILSQYTPAFIAGIFGANLAGWLSFHASYSGKVDKAKKEEMQAVTTFLSKAYEPQARTETDRDDQIEKIKEHCKESLRLESMLASVKTNFAWGTIAALLGGLTEFAKNLGGLDFVGLVVSIYFFLAAFAVGNRLMTRLSNRTS